MEACFPQTLLGAITLSMYSQLGIKDGECIALNNRIRDSNVTITKLEEEVLQFKINLDNASSAIRNKVCEKILFLVSCAVNRGILKSRCHDFQCF